MVEVRLAPQHAEARAVSALNHPKILTIYAIDEIDSEHFIATEFIEGETLRARIQMAPINSAEAIDIGIQVAGKAAPNFPLQTIQSRSI
jgi:serine/threonine protein kinase